MPFLSDLLFTSTSWFWLFISMLVGVGYALLLYKARSSHLPKRVRQILFFLRASAVAVLFFLLLAPAVRIVTRSLEKPVVILAQDNSSSIALFHPQAFSPAAYKRQVKSLVNSLRKDFEVKTFEFGESVKDSDDASFDEKMSNISELFKQVNEEFANRNIGAIMLASDGIYNQGGNPEAEALKARSPIFTIALGDTVGRRDLSISNVYYNEIAYLNNKFEINVDADAFLSKGARMAVSVRNGAGKVLTQTVPITSDDFHATIPFVVEANRKGVQRYTVNLAAIAGEVTEKNNSQAFYVNVIDGRQNILILAAAPHPDITALKQSIEVNKDYEVKVRMPDEFTSTDVQKASVLILYQIPSANPSPVPKWPALAKKNILFILGLQSDIARFSTVQDVLKISNFGSGQETFASINQDFYGFSLSDSLRSRFSGLPPLLVPSGNYEIRAPANIVLNQKVGNIDSKRPLLLFAGENERRLGVLAGEGLWKWRLQDFQDNGNHHATDEMMVKIIQYLSSRDDKRKFRAYSSRSRYHEGEHVIFSAELYNDAFELVNKPDVSLNLRDSRNQSFSFVFSRTENSYQVDAGILPPGEYTFNASTALGKDKFSSAGRFVVTEQQAEFMNSRANHQLLYSLAQQTGGKMVSVADLGKLPAILKNNEMIRSISHEEQRYEDLIDVKLVFFLILGLLVLEWVTRRRNGEI